MNTKLLNTLAAASATLLMVTACASAQSAYFNAITNLNPVGYWPLQETSTPAAATIETNYGSLGALGTAYYASSSSSEVALGATGALTGSGDNDSADDFIPSTASWLFVPRVSPLIHVKPPCTIGFWLKSSSTAFMDVLGQGGSGLNSPPNQGNAGGFRVAYGGSSPGGPNLQFYVFTGNGQTRPSLQLPGGSLVSNQWNYCVATLEGTLSSCTVTLYVNGTNASAIKGTFTRSMGSDTWSPLTIGSSWWRNYGPSGHFNGSIDDVAVYTNVLSPMQISNHWLAATTPGSDYMQTVLDDKPVLYYRMDAPIYTNAPAASFPVAANYGSTPVNAVYQPGTRPGAVAGPPVIGHSADVASPINGVTGCIDAGFNAAFNPTGTQPFTAACWFKGNPGDDRIMALMSQGTDWSLDLVGTNGTVELVDGAGSVASTNILNDGNWHFVVGVYDGSNNKLYVDGMLNNSATASGSLAGDSSHDLYLGGNANFTYVGGNQRYLAGAIAQAALFTNALTAAQVAVLFNAAAVAPTITEQPVASQQIDGGSGTYLDLNVTASGSGPAYQWYFNTTTNYSGATKLVNGTHYLNATTAQLTITNLADADSGYYFVVVTNISDSVTSLLASVTVHTAPAIISQLPVTYTNLFKLIAGASPAFSVSAAGVQPISYFWFTNGVLDAAATDSSQMVWAGVPTGLITNTCIVSNRLGTVSTVWTASVADPSGTYPAAVIAGNPIGFWRLNEPDDTLYDGNPGAIAHDYAGGNNGIYTNTLLGQTGYNTTNNDPGETAAEFGFLTFNDSDVYGINGIDFSAGTSEAFAVEAWVNGYNQTVTAAGICSKGYFNNEEFTLDVGAGPAGSRAYRFSVRGADGTAYNANSTFVPDGNWHHLVGVCDEPDGVVNLYIDSQLVASTPIPTNAGILGNDADVPVTIGSRSSSPALGNNQQFIGFIADVAIYGYALSASQVRSQFNAGGQPPSITQQPTNYVTVYVGQTLNIPVSVIGTPPLKYQWYNLNTYPPTPIPGQTNTVFVVSNVDMSYNGAYVFLTVSNAFGGVSDDANSVYVNVLSSAPQIVTNLPAQVTVAQGQSYTYSVDVVGNGPLSYQWYKGGSPVTGQTAPDYTLMANSGDAGNYYVVVTNYLGSVTSLVSTLTVVTLTNSFTGDILGLNPVGYWPLQETNAPAAATIETNYGSLGALGNAYYVATGTNQTMLGVPGALTNSGDSDAAAYFSGANNGGGSLDYLFVPRVSPALTLKPPFTLECWFNTPNNTGFGDLIGEGGSGLNNPVNAGNAGGVRLSYGGSSNPNLQLYIFDGNGQVRKQLPTPSDSMLPFGTWHYIVATYNGSIARVYIDGVEQANGAYSMAIDTWSPLSIGAGFWRGRASSYVSGSEDEVAVYTNVLTATQITNHWLAATTPGSNYVQSVLNDNPLLYYRMDAPIFTNVPAALCPVATNYGSAPTNGAYLSGTRPGFAAGPPIVSSPGGQVASPINGVTAGIDAGYDASFSPTGTKPFTALCWFRGNPADMRVQSLMSQGNNWALDVLGTNGTVALVDGAGSVASTNVLNDGNWHFVVGVYDGTANYLYVDGMLNNSAPASGTLAGDTADLYLGGNAAFPFTGDNSQQYFAGDIAQAAFLTNALTASIIQQIYQTALTVTVNPNPTSLLFSVTGNQLTLSWPADHIGWTLQAQTNSLDAGLGTNWVDVAGSTSVDQMVIPLNPDNGSVFYRLVYRP